MRRRYTEQGQVRYGIENAPVFDAVMRDEDTCRMFPERVLGIEIGSIEFANAEQEVVPSLFAHGIRLDAFVKGTDAVYDIEMQAYGEPALAKRLRYVQGAMDVALLDKGALYNSLRRSYIVFVSTKDPFGCGLPVYTFERTCREAESLAGADETTWIVLNARAWADAASGGVRNLLEYVETGRVMADPLVELLDERVGAVNDKEEVRKTMAGFISLEMDIEVRKRILEEEAVERGMAAGMEKGLEKGLKEGREQGLEQGLEQGRAQGLEQGRAQGLEQGLEQGLARFGKLNEMLIEQDRLDDLKRASADPAYRERLFQELGI